MDDVTVRTSFTPIRLVAGDTQPVGVYVEVANNSAVEKIFSVSLKIPFIFEFVSGGLLKEQRERLGIIGPRQKKDAVFRIRGKTNVQPGLYDLDIIVREHDQRFDKDVRTVRHKATLRAVSRV